jgi:hypothetical protein
MRGLDVIRGAIVVAGVLSAAGLMNSAAAVPLAPGITAMTASARLNATEIRWRHGGGGGGAVAAGLLTGMMVGGLFAAPGYYEPYFPYRHDGYNAPRYVAPIGYGAPGLGSLLHLTLSFVRSH